MSISKNAMVTASASLVPSVLTLVTVPLYLRVVGADRYGVLILCWLILGYSNFVDIGLGPALARKIAAMKRNKTDEMRSAFWTAFWLGGAAGVAAAIALYFGAGWYFADLAHFAPMLRREALASVPLIALMAPLVTLSSSINGALQGRERFMAMNLLYAFGSLLTALLPLVAALVWSPSVPMLLAGALLARAIPVPIGVLAVRATIGGSVVRLPARGHARELLSFGGWISLSGMATTMISTVDRLLIGSILGARAVSAFSIPLSLVSRTMLVPHSLGSVLFPRFSSIPDHEHQSLLSAAMAAIAVLVTPAMLLVLLAAKPFFRLWIGEDLSAAALPVAYALAGGFWVYCITYPIVGMLQARGRPDLIAKLLLAELLPYSLLVWFALKGFGLLGGAIVVSCRPLFDALVFWRFAALSWRSASRMVTPFAIVVAGIIFVSTLGGSAQYLVVGALFAASVIWSWKNRPESFRAITARLFT